MARFFASASVPMAILAGITLLGACVAPPPGPEPQNVLVSYVHPEKFTDVGNSAYPDNRMRADYLEQLRRHLVRRAASRIPPEQTLTVSITDVDMAGQFEPWRSRLYDARIIRGVYPPRIDLRFTLAAADGHVVREGSRQLRNPAFQMDASNFRDDPLRYEKTLLDDWLERELSRRRG